MSTKGPDVARYAHMFTALGTEPRLRIEPTRIYNIEDAREFLTAGRIDVDAIAPQIHDKLMSAFVRARRP